MATPRKPREEWVEIKRPLSYRLYRIDWEEKVTDYSEPERGHEFFCDTNTKTAVKTFRAVYPFEKYRILGLYQVLSFTDIKGDK